MNESREGRYGADVWTHFMTKTSITEGLVRCPLISYHVDYWAIQSIAQVALTKIAYVSNALRTAMLSLVDL
jgi:hypothetical protein